MYTFLLLLYYVWLLFIIKFKTNAEHRRMRNLLGVVDVLPDFMSIRNWVCIAWKFLQRIHYYV